MKLYTYETYKALPAEGFAGFTTVVIDVLRATSTITAALKNGAVAVTPVEGVEEGRTLADERKGKGELCICGGERGGVKIPAYDCDNSPLQYHAERVDGVHVVLCTTNGTQAIARAAQSGTVLMGCMNNASAVAAAAVREGRDIILLCSGTKEKFSCDDVVTAGAIAARILRMEPTIQTDDLTCTAMYLYNNNKGDLKQFLHFTMPYKVLMGLDLESDMDYCLAKDTAQNVPVLRGDRIVNL